MLTYLYIKIGEKKMCFIAIPRLKGQKEKRGANFALDKIGKSSRAAQEEGKGKRVGGKEGRWEASPPFFFQSR